MKRRFGFGGRVMTSRLVDLSSKPAGLPSLWALEGRWTLTRQIRHGDGRLDRLTGQAMFARSGRQLVLTETGVLNVGDQTLEARQTYIWTEAVGRIDVYFHDQRPFHSVTLGDPAPQTEHLCAPDRYHVAYDFADWPQWSATWRVEGPRKDYEMVSTYVRPRD